MIARVEPTGISVRRGKVQLRFSFYLESDDARYEEHHVQVPIMPEEGYLGEVDAEGIPVDLDAYNVWIESLPKMWQVNPFHNHFVRVSPDITDAEIATLLREHLKAFYGIWKKGQEITKVWKAEKGGPAGDLSLENIEKCELKALDIANRASTFEHKGRR